MFNKELFERLLLKYGEENMRMFCEIEAHKYTMISEDLKKRGMEDVDYAYEAFWWKEKLDYLTKTENI